MIFGMYLVYSKNNYLTMDTTFSNDGLGCFIKADYILQKIFSRHCIISRKEIWAVFLISQTVTTNWYNDTKSDPNAKSDSKDD